MNLILKGSFAILALGVAAVALAQENLLQPNVVGSATLNGNPYAGEVMHGGDMLSLLADGGTPSTSGTFAPVSDTTGEGHRSMLRFSAHGTGSFMLPSDRMGGMAAANDGDSFVTNTWNPQAYPQTGGDHAFAASVGVNGPADSASIDLEVQKAPDLSSVRTGGSYLVDMLDNSAYDQDPTAGSIVLNRDLTPNITLNYTLPSYDFSRGDVTWADGSHSNSLFRDQADSGMWFILDGGQGGTFNIFGSPFSLGYGNGVDFNVGEGPVTKSVDGFSGSYSFDITHVLNADYTGKYWAIPWHTAGYDDQVGFGSSGYVEQEIVETNIKVVPEPASMAALGLGLLGLARRRRK